jgi:hypothetical protein
MTPPKIIPSSFWAIPSVRYCPRPTPPKIAPSVAVATIWVAAARMPPEMTGTATGTSTRRSTPRSVRPMPRAASTRSGSTLEIPV